jgi:hypothetical protein
MRSVSAALFSALLAPGLAGCATGPAPEDSAPAGDEGARDDVFRVDGVVVVERLRAGDASQTTVSAKFMRHAATRAAASASTGGLEAAERLVGTRLMLPAAGECVNVAHLEEVDAEEAARSTSFEGDVELIDVGDVALVTDLAFGPALGVSDASQPSRSVVRLAPRAFPDVGDLVSGVFYTSPDAGASLPAPAHYAIESSGAAAVDRFVLSADAPAEPGDVHVAGAPLSPSATASSSKPLARRGGDLHLSWGRGPAVAAQPGDRAGDRVYVDVQAEAGAVHRCTFDDTGEAILPGAIVDGTSIAVAVHRLREVSMPMPADAMVDGDDGLADEAGRAVVRFDLAVVGRVDVR